MGLRRNAVVIASAVLITSTAVDAQLAEETLPANVPAANRAPLKPSAFVALPLGSVRPTGWLRTQLELQRDGLTGNAETVLEELNETSAWRGGDKDNWERSPYYVKGLIPLAYSLGDERLIERSKKWVEWSLQSQRPDGQYGPSQNDDWWPRMVSNYFLRDHAEATGDERVVPHLTRYYRYMLGELPKRPLKEWAKSRAGDEMDTVLWVYNRTGEPFLLEVVDLLRKQAYDWPAILHENRFQAFGKDFQPKHNVNVPQAMKMPAVSWQRTGDARERTANDAGDEHLMRDHGLSIGIQSGTEFLSGRSPGQGVEFCSIVEQMLSDETVVRIYGEGRYADRLERLAFNALPAAWNRDATALRYYTLPNHVIAKKGRHGFGQDYDNGIVYGPRSGFPCCCFNVHMGWPKFVQNSWAGTPDGGLAVIVYAPSTITATVGKDGSATATFEQTTVYPFGEEVRIKLTKLDEAASATFPLMLRTPGWCEAGATITVNGKAVDAAKPGAFAKVDREWKQGDEVVVTLPMKVRLEQGPNHTASVHRGPVIYVLKIDAERKKVGGIDEKFDEFELTPTKPWNYELMMDVEMPKAQVVVRDPSKAKPEANPFASPDAAPVTLVVPAKRLGSWTLAWNGVAAADPPPAVAGSRETSSPVESITLIPFGAAELRLTDFPLAGRFPAPRPRAQGPIALDFDDAQKNGLTGWQMLGGSWWAHDGKLRATSTGGAPGYKALVETAQFDDVAVEAKVTVPERGDAGVLCRVTRPSIGADAYEGYYAGISAEGGQVTLGRADGRSWSPLKQVDRAFKAGDEVRVRLVARGQSLQVFVGDDAKPIIEARDGAWQTGQVGVRFYCTDGDRAFTSFDDVMATPVR